MIQTTRATETKSATISSTAKAITHADFGWSSGIVAAADRVVITSRTGGVMYRYDGGTPTASIGHLLPADGTLEVIGRTNISNLKFIREAATDATLSITVETDS